MDSPVLVFNAGMALILSTMELGWQALRSSSVTAWGDPSMS